MLGSKEENVDGMTHHVIECNGLINFWGAFEMKYEDNSEYMMTIVMMVPYILISMWFTSKLYFNVRWVIEYIQTVLQSVNDMKRCL